MATIVAATYSGAAPLFCAGAAPNRAELRRWPRAGSLPELGHNGRVFRKEKEEEGGKAPWRMRRNVSVRAGCRVHRWGPPLSGFAAVHMMATDSAIGAVSAVAGAVEVHQE
jgi:hypothetical protein